MLDTRLGFVHNVIRRQSDMAEKNVTGQRECSIDSKVDTLSPLNSMRKPTTSHLPSAHVETDASTGNVS
jgi:hypothetical protein